MNAAALLARRSQIVNQAEAAAVRALEYAGATIRRDDDGRAFGVEAVGQTFSDDVTKQLQALPGLKRLNLIFTQITGRGVGRLANLIDLEAIDLGGSIQVDDEGARAVARLFGASSVSLWDTAITDHGARSIADLPRVEFLYVSGTRIGDAGLAHFCRFKRLRGLDVHATKVTDKGLANVARMPRLEWLDLSFTGVTDAGLEQLESLVGLQRLHLKHTKVTAIGIHRLRKKLPRCRVLLAA